jgi:hypothetical protein
MLTPKSKMLAVLMEQDSYFTQFGLIHDYTTAFGADDGEAEIKRLISDFESDATLIGFDVESDGMDGILIDHNEHGQLDPNDYDVIGAANYLSIGPAFPIVVHQELNSISEAAVVGGFSETLRLLALLPVDSSGWTGTTSNLRFTPEIQTKIVAVLEHARLELNDYSLSNVEAKKASAYIDCALIMAQLPEPEPDLVALLIKRLLVIVGFVGVFADFKEIFS